MIDATTVQLPGLDCGLCGFRTCEEFQERLAAAPELLRRCIHLSKDGRLAGVSRAPGPQPSPRAMAARRNLPAACAQCNADPRANACTARSPLEACPSADPQPPTWRDHLDREFDFYLEHFPEEPGPREIILPHNPMLARELDIQRGDVLIGRPLGMSCGCPITHCGVVMEVDQRTGVMAWCVTGPLEPRKSGYKDLGYYIAEGYEGLVTQTRCELKIGMRYFFQPRMCMLQWRHSGLLNYLSKREISVRSHLPGTGPPGASHK